MPAGLVRGVLDTVGSSTASRANRAVTVSGLRVAQAALKRANCASTCAVVTGWQAWRRWPRGAGAVGAGGQAWRRCAGAGDAARPAVRAVAARAVAASLIMFRLQKRVREA